MIAGQRRPRTERQEVVNIDYADVLRQAVANERFRVISEIRQRVGAIQTNEYGSRPASGAQVKLEALAAINAVDAMELPNA